MVGGIAEYVHQLAKHLAKKYSVRVFSTVPDSHKAAIKDYPMTSLAPRPTRNLGQKSGDKFSLIRKINTYQYYQTLEKISQSEIKAVKSQDILVIITCWSIETHFWCKACLKMGVDYLILTHGLELCNPLLGSAQGWRKRDLLSAKRPVANSFPTASLIKKIVGQECLPYVLHPGLDLEQYSAPTAEEIMGWRKFFGFSKNSQVLLTLGRLVKRKGADLVIEALHSLRGQYSELCLIIAGSGPEESSLREKVKDLKLEDKVFFIKDFDDAKKWQLYSVCDIFVMPNRLLGGTDWEGFGIVFLEAALAGKPSIGGNNGGAPDAIIHEKTGLLVETDDFEETAKAIKRMVSSPKLCLEMGRAAHARAVQEFGWENITNQFSKECF